jgi:hypothetical protein
METKTSAAGRTHWTACLSDRMKVNTRNAGNVNAFGAAKFRLLFL